MQHFISFIPTLFKLFGFRFYYFVKHYILEYQQPVCHP